MTDEGLLAPTWSWIEAANHAGANLLLRRAGMDVPWSTGAETDRRRFIADPIIQGAFDKQREDGSWGAAAPSEDRILPTMWVVKTLVESGLDQETDEVYNAIEFLARVGRTRRGYFSTTHDDAGVLACYVGMAARVYREAGRPDLEAYQLDWLTRYQRLTVAGEEYREFDDWGNDLETRYGGCFSRTSCLVGVVRATGAWNHAQGEDRQEAFVAGRELLLERSLAFTRDGTTPVSLPSPGSKADGWVPPAFPTDWRIDLVTILDDAGRAGSAFDQRASRAIQLLMSLRRSDGSWSRGWHVTSGFLKGLGAPTLGEGNAIVTARAALALAKWID